MKWILKVVFIFLFGSIFAQEEVGSVCTRKFPLRENIRKVRVDLEIEADGKVGLEMKCEYAGVKAERDSLLFWMRKPEDEKRKWISTRVACGKLELKDFRFFEPEGNDVPEIGYEIKGTLIGFCGKSGDRLFFSPFSFSGIKDIPLSSGDGVPPVEISCSFTQIDTISVSIPEGYVVETGIAPVFLYSPYGEYSTEVSRFKDKIYLKRNFLLKAGIYPKEAYEGFQLFIQQVQLQDRFRMVLKPRNK